MNGEGDIIRPRSLGSSTADRRLPRLDRARDDRGLRSARHRHLTPHLVRHLLDAHHAVRALDDDVLSHRQGESRSRTRWRSTTSTGDYYRRIAAARKPVFSIGTVAMAVTMVTAIIGASVDTGVLPPMVHAMIAYGAIVVQPRRREDRDLRPLRIQPHRRRGQPSDPVVTRRGSGIRRHVEGVSAGCARSGSRQLRVAAGDRVAHSRVRSAVGGSVRQSRDRRDAARRGRGQRLRPADHGRSTTAPTGWRPSIDSGSSASAPCCSTRSR